MATREVVRDQPARPLSPIDDSVVIPESVRRAAAMAESFYGKAPEKPAETPEPTPPPAAEAPPAPTPPPVEQPAPPPQAQQAPPPQQPQEPAEDNWHHRYLSMQGRYNQAQQTIGAMQEQLQELSTELLRTQDALRGQGQQKLAQQAQQPERLITAEDEQAYGTELIDLTKRAALEAVAPKLSKLEQENQQLRQRVASSSRQVVFDNLAREVPNWQAINRDQRFKNWLRLPDVYSGAVRQQMLDAAFQAANAPRVIAFFKGFLAEESATGHSSPAPQVQQAPTPPRTPAVPLETLASPGRARSASGEPSTAAEKPVYSRAQISNFYTDVRRGVYAGRDNEKNQMEQSIFAAQREGRVR